LISFPMHPGRACSPAWPEAKAVMASTADISEFLDLFDLPAGSDTQSATSDLQNVDSFGPSVGSTSNQSSSGSGNSSPQHDYETMMPAVPEPTGSGDQELWEEIMGLDGTTMINGLPAAPAAIPFTAHRAAPYDAPPATPLPSKARVVAASAAAKPPSSRRRSGSSAASTLSSAFLKVPCAAPPVPLPHDATLAMSTSPTERQRRTGSAARKRGSPKSAAAVASAALAGEPHAAGALGASHFDFDQLEALEGDDEGGGEESAEVKRMKRMKRNRESAAMSRHRKKQYVEELEARLAKLDSAMRSLKSENLELRQECARMRGGEGAAPLPQFVSDTSLLQDALSMPDMDIPSLEAGILAEDGDTLASAPAAESVVPVHPGATARMASGGAAGGASKVVSAASLVVMSTLALVTFVGSSSMTTSMGSGGYAHAPGSRMLMSVGEAATHSSWSASSLWRDTAEHGMPAAWKPFDDHGAAAANAVHLPVNKDRVIHAPQNSSWADVLRIEAAEEKLAEAQLEMRALRATAAKAALPAGPALAAPEGTPDLIPTPPKEVPKEVPVFEHVDEDEHASEYDYSHEYNMFEAERFIFCSRAYMFDAAVRRPSAVGSTPAVSPLSSPAELELPSAMPPRFRHASMYREMQAHEVQRANNNLPQLSDGRNESAPAQRPVVTLLLPSAALRGVVGSEDTPMGKRGGASDSDLMQVQCQVMNASRFSAGGPQ